MSVRGCQVMGEIIQSCWAFKECTEGTRLAKDYKHDVSQALVLIYYYYYYSDCYCFFS